MDATTCCNNADLCNKRRARGLKAFCDTTLAAAPRERPSNEFGSYAQAVEYARVHGGSIRRVGNFMDGGPRRFVVA